MTETCIINQYDFNTGTKLVISGFNQFKLATNNNIEATKEEATNVNSDFLEKNIPANIVANAIKITDS